MRITDAERTLRRADGITDALRLDGPMRRTVQAMLGIAIVLDITYWTLWYAARGVVASQHTSAYYDFENAFPLADAWLGLACVLALITLTRGRPTAPFWLVCAGSAGAYLFGMDFLYDVEHGIFGKGGGGAFEAVIVSLTLVFSVTVLTWTRRAFGNPVTPR